MGLPLPPEFSVIVYRPDGTEFCRIERVAYFVLAAACVDGAIAVRTNAPSPIGAGGLLEVARVHTVIVPTLQQTAAPEPGIVTARSMPALPRP